MKTTQDTDGAVLVPSTVGLFLHLPDDERQEIQAYRDKYGIREATQEEWDKMSDVVKRHYLASRLKPHGMHYDTFNGLQLADFSVRPVYLHLTGSIGFSGPGASWVAAVLAPYPTVSRNMPNVQGEAQPPTKRL